MILSTVYMYLRDVIGTDYPNLCYGLIITLFNLSSTISGPICGRWVDRTRKIKTYLNVILTLQLCGNLLYAIPYSVVFPIVGRVLAGISDPFGNVCTGEVLRIYTGEEGTRALWWLASTYSIGFVTGPGVAIFFRDIKFNIGGIRVNHLNFVGFFIAGLGLVALFVCNFMLHDCSRQFDLKEYLRDREQQINKDGGDASSGDVRWDRVSEVEGYGVIEHKYSRLDDQEADDKTWKVEDFGDDDEMSSTTEQHSVISFDEEFVKTSRDPMPIGKVIRGLGTNPDAILLFTATFVLVFSLFGTDVLVPLLVENVFKWPSEVTSYIFITFGMCYFVLVIVMSTYFTSDLSVYAATMVCVLSQLLQYVLLYAITSLR